MARSRLGATVTAFVVFAVGAGCAAIGGLGDYKEVDCIGAACSDGGNTGGDASSSSSSGGGDDGGSGTLDFVTIGGSVTALAGKGLILANNGSDDLQVGKDGPFTFPAKVRTGDPYEVTVKAQPSEPTQACTVTNGSGTANGANVTNVAVSCATSAFKIGGTVVGLTAGNVVLSNGGEDLTVSANGPFGFVNKVASGGAFAVTVKSGTCTVSGGTGTVGVSDVNSIVVNCAPGTYTVGGSIAGLNGTVVIQNNGANDTTLTSNGTFAFTTTLTPSQTYAITVKTQPSYPPRSQTCVVANGTGTIASANVTNVAINCTTSTFPVGGNVTGLTGTLVLKNNGGNDLSLTQNGAFAFSTPIASGSAYAVTVAAQPAGQTCTLSNASGTVTSAAIANVGVSCATATADQGTLCTGNVYCNPVNQFCCFTSGAGVCTDKCAGGGSNKFLCDGPADCAAIGQPQNICCGAITGADPVNSYCTAPSQCPMGGTKAYFCNPSAANPCPNGGTCTATNSPMPGYYRCF